MAEALILPAWEYWVGDPEIEELLAEAAAPRRATDVLADVRDEAPGLRWGRGSPDDFGGKLARPKPERPPPEPRTPIPDAGNGRTWRSGPRAACAGCGQDFTKRRSEQRYCTRACAPRPGRPRERPLECACSLCGRRFEPAENRDYLYCSRACANRATAPKRSVRKRKKETA